MDSCHEKCCDFEDGAEDVVAGLLRIRSELLEHEQERQPLEIAGSVDDPTESQNNAVEVVVDVEVAVDDSLEQQKFLAP